MPMKDFIIRKYIVEDTTPVRKLIHKVWQEIPVKEWFAVDDDYLDTILEDKHTWIIEAVEVDTEQLAAILVLVFPEPGDDNLGMDIGLSEEQQLKVVHMDTAATLPELRGYSLQHRMMDYAEFLLKTAGVEYLMCTVHPENVYSRRNVEKLGYKCVKTGFKYGGMPRCVYLKLI